VQESGDTPGGDDVAPSDDGGDNVSSAEPVEPAQEFGTDDLDWGAFVVADPTAVAEVIGTGPRIGSQSGDALAIGGLITGAAATILEAARSAVSEVQQGFMPSVMLRPVEYPASVRLRFTLGEENLQILDEEGETAPSIEAAKQVRDLIESVNDRDRLQGQLLELGKDVASAYDRLLQAAADYEVHVTWRTRDGVSTEMTSDSAVIGREILDEPIVDAEEAPTRFVGRLNAADADRQGFALHLQTRWKNKTKISGKYRPEIEAVIQEENLWNKMVIATIQVSWVHKVKDPEPRPQFDLVSVREARAGDPTLEDL